MIKQTKEHRNAAIYILMAGTATRLTTESKDVRAYKTKKKGKKKKIVGSKQKINRSHPLFHLPYGHDKEQ